MKELPLSRKPIELRGLDDHVKSRPRLKPHLNCQGISTEHFLHTLTPQRRYL